MNDLDLIKKYSINEFKLMKYKTWLYIDRFSKDFLSKQKTTGKYLFFSPNKEELVKLAQKIMKKFDLIAAKTPDDDHKIGNEWVLCIYDISPRYDLNEFETSTILYRGWKSDTDTIKGIYSEKFEKLMKKEAGLNDCNCNLKPTHLPLEHDSCCQVCGGSHTERICPQRGD
jgi:hypothetical protein